MMNDPALEFRDSDYEFEDVDNYDIYETEVEATDIEITGVAEREEVKGWYLAITEAEFDRIYAGLPILKDKHLFYANPISDEALIEDHLPSKLWRLNNLYWIIDKAGIKTNFLMNYAQHVVYAASVRHPRIIILKSRQQGISTFWLISYEDDGIFNTDFNIGMLAQGLEEAGTLLTRSKLAWDEFPLPIKEFLGVYITSDNTKQMGYSNGSTIFIRTSFRSATLQRLHVSELGKIANKDPKKARELKTGTMQAIAAGHTVVIESTAEGSNNMFSQMWNEAVNFVGKNRPPKAFFPVFLSWTEDPDCNLNLEQDIDKEAADYFIKVETELGITLTDSQKWFWVQQKAELNEDIGQEYPATPDEAFASVRDGAYYAKLFRQHVMVKKRMVKNCYDIHLPVYCSADIGVNDATVLIFFQVLGKEWRIIAEYHNSGEAIAHYANVISSMPFRIKRLFLPHDSKATSFQTSMSTLGIFRKLGFPAKALRKVEVAHGIENVRRMIPNLYIDEELGYVKDTFLNYSKEWNDILGVWKDKPKHDSWSDPADAIRYMAMSGVGDLKDEFTESIRGRGELVDKDFPDAPDSLQYSVGLVVDGLAL